MKKRYTILLFIALFFTACLSRSFSFAEEPNAQENALTAQNTDTQDNSAALNPTAKQEQEKQILQSQSAQETGTNKAASEKERLQDKNLQNQDTDKAIKKDVLFPVSQEPVPSFGWGNYFQGIGIMLLLLFAFWYILKLMRKYGNGRFLPNQKLLPRDSMYLEGQLPLGQGKSIVIVHVLDERLVLGVTEKNINLLSKTGTNHAETFEELMEQVPFKNTPHA